MLSKFNAYIFLASIPIGKLFSIDSDNSVIEFVLLPSYISLVQSISLNEIS